ncbi:MAG: hypothetical protein AAGK97_18035 [Bacteroidota bacterium]
MKISKISMVCIVALGVYFTSFEKDPEPCVKTTWFEDADGDGLGNPDVIQ